MKNYMQRTQIFVELELNDIESNFKTVFKPK